MYYKHEPLRYTLLILDLHRVAPVWNRTITSSSLWRHSPKSEYRWSLPGCNSSNRSRGCTQSVSILVSFITRVEFNYKVNRSGLSFSKILLLSALRFWWSWVSVRKGGGVSKGYRWAGYPCAEFPRSSPQARAAMHCLLNNYPGSGTYTNMTPKHAVFFLGKVAEINTIRYTRVLRGYMASYFLEMVNIFTRQRACEHIDLDEEISGLLPPQHRNITNLSYITRVFECFFFTER